MNDPPALVAPMLATLGSMPHGSDWAFELKWDGVRAVSYLRAGAPAQLFSRNNLDITGTYPELAALTRFLPDRDVILDGEIVALGSDGRPSFARLQDRMHVQRPSSTLLATVPVVYLVFDVLRLDGGSTVGLPYRRRRELLAGLGLVDEVVRVPPNFAGVSGDDVLAAAEAYGLEGVIAKRLRSTYQPGRRSPDWMKVPLNRTQEVVIIGYKAGGGRRAGTVGSLVLGVYDHSGQLTFAGGVGTGFTGAMLAHLHDQLRPLHRPTPPAPVPREHARGVQWVEPVLTGEVAYRNWTPDGRLRHPSWRGLRSDRRPQEAVLPQDQPPPVTARKASPAGVEGAMQTPDGSWRVEAVGNGGARWYRIIHGDSVIDWLSIEDVETLLRRAGVDLASLTSKDREPRPVIGPQRGSPTGRRARSPNPLSPRSS